MLYMSPGRDQSKVARAQWPSTIEEWNSLPPQEFSFYAPQACKTCLCFGFAQTWANLFLVVGTSNPSKGHKPFNYIWFAKWVNICDPRTFWLVYGAPFLLLSIIIRWKTGKYVEVQIIAQIFILTNFWAQTSLISVLWLTENNGISFLGNVPSSLSWLFLFTGYIFGLDSIMELIAILTNYVSFWDQRTILCLSPVTIMWCGCAGILGNNGNPDFSPNTHFWH